MMTNLVAGEGLGGGCGGHFSLHCGAEEVSGKVLNREKVEVGRGAGSWGWCICICRIRRVDETMPSAAADGIHRAPKVCRL